MALGQIGLETLEERRAVACRLTPDRALESLDEAEAFLPDRGLLTLMPDCSLPSLFGACHEEPYKPGGRGFAGWPKTKWRWGGALAARPGIFSVRLHAGKGLFLTEKTAALADPLCRAELAHADEGAVGPAARRLVGHLAEAGPAAIDELKEELGLGAKELRALRARLERVGAVIAMDLRTETEGGGHRHTSELYRWDQVFPTARSGARGDERLDRPRRRLRVGVLTRGEGEPPVPVLQPAEVPEPPADGSAAQVRRPKRLDSRGGVVRVGRAPGGPRPTAARVLPAQDVPDARRGCRTACRTEGDHAPDGRVDERTDPAVGPAHGRQSIRRLTNILPERVERQNPERQLVRGRRGPGGQVLRRRRASPPQLRGVATRCPDRHHGPGSEGRIRRALRLCEATVRLLALDDVAATKLERRRLGRDEESQRDGGERGQPHVHTTSVRRRRSCRVSTRRSSGPATSASTRLPTACARLNATPAPSTTSSADDVCGQKPYQTQKSISVP